MKTNLFTDQGKALVSKIEHEGYLKQDIDRALTAIGGLGRLVTPGDTILVKPNFNTADPPPAASDPGFVRAVIELLYEQGAGKVIVGESSKIGLSTRRTLHEVGMFQTAELARAEVVVFDEGEWVPTRTGGEFLKRVSLARPVLDAEKIVYVCSLKTHRLADFTLSLKLGMGFVRPRERVAMHLGRLREKLVDLNLVVAPDLVIVDARRCFITGGPSRGAVREPNLVLASGDRVAIDREGAKIIQSYPGHSLDTDPSELAMIRRAVELGLGATTEAAYQVIAADSRGR